MGQRVNNPATIRSRMVALVIFNKADRMIYGATGKPIIHTSWTEDRIELLKKLTDEGLSCSQIGLELGISRNAVIGKQHRLSYRSKNWKGGSLPGTRPRRQVKTRISGNGRLFRAIEAAEPVELFPEIPLNPKNIVEISDSECHWPSFGAGVATMFCGAPAIKGFSYCLAHCRIAYLPPGSRGNARRPARNGRAAA